VQVEPIFLKDSASGKSPPASERSSLDSFFSNIVAGSYIPSLLSQYSAGGQTIGAGSKGADDIDVPVTRDTSFTSTTDGNFYSAISDTNIRNVIANEITHGKTAPVNANTLYFVFTPPGTPVVNVPGSPSGNSVDGDGGYSSHFSLGGQNVYYAVVFDPNPPNASLNDLGFGSLASQQLTVVASHQLAEAITDPLSDLSTNHGTGWYDRNLNQQVADLVEAQNYTQDGNVVQYQWSQPALGPAHAPGTAGNNNNLFINQLTPPAVDTFAGGPVATFTDPNPSLTASSFTAYVSFNGFEGLQPATVSGGNNGLYVISAAPSAPLGDGQYGVPFPNDTYLDNGGMQVYVFDQADGGVAQNAPLSARYAPYAVSVAASLTYNADAGGLAHNFRLVKNAGTGNFELYDHSNLVFTQPIAQTFDIEIGADPGVDSSLTLDYSGGAFNVPITFDGGSGAGQHALTVINGSFTQESYSATDSTSGTFGLDGQAITVSHVTAANIPTTLAIATPLQTVLAGQASNPIAVQLQDPFGNSIAAGAGGVTIQLSTTSNGGSFLTTSGQPLSGNSITIAAGADSAAFEYKDAQPGTPTITATATSSQPASLSPASYTLNIASFIVTTTSNEDDGSPDPALGTGTSLREAIKAANANPGLDFIAFNIPGSGVHTIMPAGLTITDTVIIDGYTQPGATPNTNAIDDPDPQKRGFNGVPLIELAGTSGGTGLKFQGGPNSIIRGLIINRWTVGIGFDLTAPATGVKIEGNFIGTDPAGMAGTAGLGNGTGIQVYAFDSGIIIGGTTAAARNVISNNGATGIELFTTDSTIQGNLIGTDKTGLSVLGNIVNNVSVHLQGIVNDANNQIGGTVPGSRNVLAGGLHISQGSASNRVEGNFVGVDVTGSPFSTGSRILIDDSPNNVIGGTSPNAGNLIGGGGDTGVIIRGTAATGNAILGNSILRNIGIDLGFDGATPNDPGDADTGPNNLQNFPVISYATRDAGNLKVTYNVPSDPANSTYPLRVEFFLSDANGQGQTFLGFDTFTSADFTAGGKTANFATNSPIKVFDKIVSTATDSLPAASGGGPANTSEFSAQSTIVSPWQNPGHLRWDVNDDAHVAADDVLTIINFINAHHSGLLPDDAQNKKPYYDVDGDNHVVAIDVLNVINYINAGRPMGGEAEAPWEGEAPAEPLAASSQLPVANGQAPAASDVMAILAADVAAETARKQRSA
jgi:hypothetical protein